MEENPESYDAAFKRLQAIEADLENDEISIDELASKVEEASKLLAFCQAKLRATSDKVEDILKTLQDGE